MSLHLYIITLFFITLFFSTQMQYLIVVYMFRIRKNILYFLDGHKYIVPKSILIRYVVKLLYLVSLILF